MTIYKLPPFVFFVALISWNQGSEASNQCMDLFSNTRRSSYINDSDNIRFEAKSILSIFVRHMRPDLPTGDYLYATSSNLYPNAEGTRFAFHHKAIVVPPTSSAKNIVPFADAEVKTVLSDLLERFKSISPKLNFIKLLENYGAGKKEAETLIIKGKAIPNQGSGASISRELNLKALYFFEGDFFILVNTANNKIVGKLTASRKDDLSFKSSDVITLSKLNPHVEVDSTLADSTIQIDRAAFKTLLENINIAKLEMEAHALQRFTVLETLDPMNHKPLASSKSMVFIDYVHHTYYKPILFSTTYSGSKELMQKLYADGVLKNTFSRYNYETFLEELRFAGYFAETIPFEGSNKEIFEMDQSHKAILGILRDSDEFSSLPIIGVNRELIPHVPR